VPQDGWLGITLQKRTSGFVDAKINGSTIVQCYCNSTSIGMVETVNGFVPVKKGDILTFSFTTSDEMPQYYTMFGLR
jgi:hypothetical protein